MPWGSALPPLACLSGQLPGLASCKLGLTLQSSAVLHTGASTSQLCCSARAVLHITVPCCSGPVCSAHVGTDRGTGKGALSTSVSWFVSRCHSVILETLLGPWNIKSQKLVLLPSFLLGPPGWFQVTSHTIPMQSLSILAPPSAIHVRFCLCVFFPRLCQQQCTFYFLLL